MVLLTNFELMKSNIVITIFICLVVGSIGLRIREAGKSGSHTQSSSIRSEGDSPGASKNNKQSANAANTGSNADAAVSSKQPTTPNTDSKQSGSDNEQQSKSQGDPGNSGEASKNSETAGKTDQSGTEMKKELNTASTDQDNPDLSNSKDKKKPEGNRIDLASKEKSCNVSIAAVNDPDFKGYEVINDASGNCSSQLSKSQKDLNKEKQEEEAKRFPKASDSGIQGSSAGQNLPTNKIYTADEADAANKQADPKAEDKKPAEDKANGKDAAANAGKSESNDASAGKGSKTEDNASNGQANQPAQPGAKDSSESKQTSA